MSAPAIATPSHCPTCGMKIARAGLSICSYCSAPLELARGPATPQDDATRARLARMREHKDWPAALAWVPPEEPATERALQRRRFALVLLVCGALLVVFGALSQGVTRAWRSPMAWIGAFPMLFGLGGWVAASRQIQSARALPIVRRAALVTARRSETDGRGGPGSTVYYFTLAFEEGTGAEFRFPGRGAHHELLVPGNTGLAYTRRNELLDFSPIRV
jgi:hypothetical protein